MKILYALFNLLAVGLCLFWILIIHKQETAFEIDYDSEVLAMATDYAAVGALDASLKSGSIGTDYTGSYKTSITVDKTLEIFTTIMCMNYNMSIGEENRNAIEDAIGAMVICCYDGYYEVTPEEDGLHFLLKQPYVVDLYNDDYTSFGSGAKLNVSVALRVGEEGGLVIKNNEMVSSIFSSYEDLAFTLADIGAGSLNTPIFREKVPVLISNIMNEAITRNAQTIREARQNNTDREYRFYIPSFGSNDGANSIQGPTLMVIMNGGKFSGKGSLKKVMLSGYRVVDVNYVTGFTENGMSYYCYDYQLPEHYRDREDVVYFKSVYEAAREGFIPHIEYMTTYNELD